MRGSSTRFSSLTKTEWGREYDENSIIFTAPSSSIMKSTATFPTFPMPGSPSIKIGSFNLGIVLITLRIFQTIRTPYNHTDNKLGEGIFVGLYSLLLGMTC